MMQIKLNKTWLYISWRDKIDLVTQKADQEKYVIAWFAYSIGLLCNVSCQLISQTVL